MITPGLKDLEPFAKYRAIDFERWLRVGLEGYLLEDKGVWEFEHLGVFLGKDMHLVLDLKAIYDQFSARQQAGFRQAVADLIATLEADACNAILFEYLLMLAAALPAPEVLKVLPVRIGNGFFGTVRLADETSLFGRTFETVADLALPTSDALKCLHALISSIHFETAYAGLALVSLCRVNPEGFVDHMVQMRDRLNDMFQTYKLSKEDKNRLAEQIAQALGLYNLVSGLCDLRIVDTQKRSSLTDDWLLEALLWHKKPVLKYIKCEDNTYLAWADNPASIERIPNTIFINVPYNEPFIGDKSILENIVVYIKDIINIGAECLGNNFEAEVISSLQHGVL